MVIDPAVLVVVAAVAPSPAPATTDTDAADIVDGASRPSVGDAWDYDRDPYPPCSMG